jgi:rhodanese-related sulfurtransferase
MLSKYLEVAALKDLTENPVDDIWIIDVRPNDAYERAHIPTAKSFPSSEIEGRLNELPKDKYLILYCETGGRAQKVIRSILEPAGYTKFMNWGGYTRWN